MNIIDTLKQLVKNSSTSPRAISHFAVRHDGVILVSLEDAGGRDLTRREVVSYLVLTPEEAEHLRSSAEEGAYAATSVILANLPKRKVEA